MKSSIPSATSVRAALCDLSIKQLEQLAVTSGVPMTTIYKIRLGETKNPGIETVRKFLHHIDAAKRFRGTTQRP